jgi:hypothetical protein
LVVAQVVVGSSPITHPIKTIGNFYRFGGQCPPYDWAHAQTIPKPSAGA